MSQADPGEEHVSHPPSPVPRQGNEIPPQVSPASRRGKEIPPQGDPIPWQGNEIPLQGNPAAPRGDLVHPKVDAVPHEARPFQGQRAGVVTRTAANVLDFLLAAGVVAGAYAAWCAVTFLINPTKFSFPTVSFLLLLICTGAVLFTYFTVSWATTGRTFGDHQLGLRVVNPRGEQLRWPGAVIRAAFCVVLPIGLYWAIISPTNRSVQDAVLRTSVIYDWTVRRRTPSRITRPG
jgi:uncharacterized RDD family membrane protein YckC